MIICIFFNAIVKLEPLELFGEIYCEVFLSSDILSNSNSETLLLLF